MPDYVLLVERQCHECKSNTSGISGFYRNPDLLGTWLCNKCYMKNMRRTRQAFGGFQDFKNKLNQRRCSNCDSDHSLLSYTKTGYPYQRWTKDGKGGWYCNRCYLKLVYRPKWTRFGFRDKEVYVREEFNPRTGKCSNCGKTGKRTHMHHIKYHEDDLLKDTIELCVSCHAKETWKERRMTE